MFRRRVLLWSAAACSLGSLLVLAVCCQGPPRVRVGADWTPERLAQELGEEWEAKPGYDPGSLVLRRQNNPLSWDELKTLAVRHASAFAAVPDRLLIAPDPWGEGEAEGDRNTLHLGHLLVRGHPDELRRVAAKFTY